MTFALKPIFSSVNPIKPCIFPPQSFFSVSRKDIPPVNVQHRNFGTFTDKVLYMLTGMKRLNIEETQQAIKHHQKLFVVHASIANHDQASEHYEKYYAMQLFREPKDYSTKEYYLNLLEGKKIEDLSINELREIVELYQYGLKHNDSILYAFVIHQKLQKYQSLLSHQEKGSD